MQLQPREPLRFAPVGPAQAQRALWPPLGQGRGHNAPKNTSWLQGVCSQLCHSCGSWSGCALCLQSPPETLTPWDFASCRDVASQWKVSKMEEPSKPGLKITGFRVVTFLCKLGDLHQSDPQRGAAWEAQVHSVSPRAGLSLWRKQGLSCCFQFRIHPKVIHQHHNSCQQALGHSRPCAEQSIQKQRSYPNVL